MKIIIDNQVRFKTEHLSGDLIQELKESLTFVNPKYVENEKYGRWNGCTEKVIMSYKTISGSFVMPRGCLSMLRNLLDRNRYCYTVDNRSITFDIGDIGFRGNLYDYQSDAIHALMSEDNCVLQAPTGAGKTVIACKIISLRKQRTLVLVHTKELMYQWQQRIAEFLNFTKDEIGLIGDGKKSFGSVTVAIVKSAMKHLTEIQSKIGLLIVDEVHRCPSTTFSNVVKNLHARYMLGLSATPYRRDNLTKLIHFHIGELACRIGIPQLQTQKKLAEASVITRRTKFSWYYRDDYHDMISAITTDIDRNKMIVSDIYNRTVNGNGTALVLSDRKAHCELLMNSLADERIECRLLTGDMKTSERNKIISELNECKIKVLISTSQLLSEGFDCKYLSSIFLTTPIKYAGRLTQCVGRILRTSPNQGVVMVYDYVDGVGVLYASYRSRVKCYRDLGIKVL